MPRKQKISAKTRARRRAIRDFHVARSEAMNAFAQLESNMSGLFTDLLATNHQKGLIAFAAISDARTRLVMLSRLVENTYGETYKTFFDGFVSNMQLINQARNKLVHWMLTTSQKRGGKFDRNKNIFLAEHPNVFRNKRVYLANVRSFKHELHFYGDLVFYFENFLVVPGIGNPNKTPWRDIFQSKPVYPPPSGHQLDHYRKKPYTPLQSFGV